MERRTAKYAVTGDYNRMVYSTHLTREAAERAARALEAKWVRESGKGSLPGSEPRVIELDPV